MTMSVGLWYNNISNVLRLQNNCQLSCYIILTGVKTNGNIFLPSNLLHPNETEAVGKVCNEVCDLPVPDLKAMTFRLTVPTINRAVFPSTVREISI